MRRTDAIVTAICLTLMTGCGGSSQAVPQTIMPSGAASPNGRHVSPERATRGFAVTDLGTLGGPYSGARAINDAGEVTGASSRSDGAFHAFTYTVSGGMIDIGSLGGSTGFGNGINASGDVAGYSTKADGTYHAFLYHGGKMEDIGDLGGGTATAYALNDAGAVVGSSSTSTNLTDPFLYRHGHMKDLGTLGSGTVGWWNNAAGINRSGAVVGISYDASGDFLAFLWKGGHMVSLGTLGGTWSQAQAINDRGNVTGQAYTAGNAQAHAFLWAGGKMKDLGVLPGSVGYSWGFGINKSATVVGKSEQQGPGSGYIDRAFVYRSGKLQDLNDLIPANSGWVLNTAYAVNASGAIVGEGTIGGRTHAFLLTPQ